MDDHILPNVKDGLAFVGGKAAEGVDSLAEAVMGPEAKYETSEALKTLHEAFVAGEDNKSADLASSEDYYEHQTQAWGFLAFRH